MLAVTIPKDNPPAKKRRTPWYWRIVRTAILLYMVMLIGACMFQEKLIFPGAGRSHGMAEFVVTPPKNAQLIQLQTASKAKAVALFGPALDKRGDPRPDAATCPTILYFYGNGMCLSDTVDFEFSEFRQLGCNVMIVEYLGYGMSEGSPSQQGCFEAADAAYAALVARPDIDPKHIITGGWSLGGAVACHVAATHPVTGLFMFSSFTSMTDVAHSHYPFLPVSLLLRHPFRSIDIIGDIKVPILIGHGTEDDLIPYAMSETMKASAKSSPSVTHFRVEGAAHNDFYTMGQPEIFREVAAFIAECSPIK